MKKKLSFVVLCAVLIIGAGLWFSRWQSSSQDISAGAKINDSGPSVLAQRQEQVNETEVNQKITKLQIPFIANQGQTDKEVRFYGNTFGGLCL